MQGSGSLDLDFPADCRTKSAVRENTMTNVDRRKAGSGGLPKPVQPRPLPDGAQVFRRLRVARERLVTRFDPFGIGVPIAHAQLAWVLHPQELGERMFQLSADILELQAHTLRRSLGLPSDDPVPPRADDARFVDPVWTESATWDLVKEWYLAVTHHVQDILYETPALSDRERRRAAFWGRKWLNTVAPTNYLWSNPVALQKLVETHGESLWRGTQNMMEDVLSGNVRMTNPDDFKVGENLATTPGAVIFRNRLLEIIHYAPRTERVGAEPLAIVTPWINKYRSK